MKEDVQILCVYYLQVEVTHDFQQQIRRYVVEDLKMLNLYDTWDGVYLNFCIASMFQ